MPNTAHWSPRQERFMNDRTLGCSRYESYEEEDEVITVSNTKHNTGIISLAKSEAFRNNRLNNGMLARFFSAYAPHGARIQPYFAI